MSEMLTLDPTRLLIFVATLFIIIFVILSEPFWKKERGDDVIC